MQNMTELARYNAIFGDIVFPDQPGEGQSKVRREIYANPAGWMYSMDGLTWEKAPMDIGKIDYPNALFRRIPEGMVVGVNADISGVLNILDKIPDFQEGKKNLNMRKIKKLMEDMEYDDEVVNNVNLDFSMGFCIAKEIIQDLLKKHFREM